MHPIRIHPEVADGLEHGTPIVVLESAVITSGLPRNPLPADSRLRASAQQFKELAGWIWDAPINLELGRAMHRVVRQAGATPATVAIMQGQLCIGLNDDDLELLAADPDAGKSSLTDLAQLMTNRATAGTTVSATLAASRAARSSFNTHDPALSVFATGGIGGVHRGWQKHLDVSADLHEIARTPICVVSSGAKSILDLPATLETLEALGVPVVGWRTNVFPQFFSCGTDDLPINRRKDTIDDAAALCDMQWNTLGRREGILLCNPPPKEFAIDANEIEAAIEQAIANAQDQGIRGAARTPFLLAELARLTNGRTLDTNLMLLLNNARLAAELAVALAARRTHGR